MKKKISENWKKSVRTKFDLLWVILEVLPNFNGTAILPIYILFPSFNLNILLPKSCQSVQEEVGKSSLIFPIDYNCKSSIIEPSSHQLRTTH